MGKAKDAYVIWDWNGTLLDDMAVCMEAENVILARYGLPPLESAERYRQLFGFPVQGYYERLGFDFETLDFSTVAAEYVAQYHARLSQCELFSGVRETLNTLQAAGFKQIVLSASGQESLALQMERFALDDYFVAIVGIADDFARGKKELALRLFQETGIKGLQACFLGDTVHDYEVATACGAACILVANGHQPKEKLLGTGAVVVDEIQQTTARIIEAFADRGSGAF